VVESIMKKHKHGERGIALVIALFLTAALSALASSLMFLSQTETYASMNYRMMSQARYAGEAAVQKAADFLLDSSQYAMPGNVSDPLVNFNRTVSPVTYMGQPVVLSAVDDVPSNYPVAAVVDAFEDAAEGALTAGNATLSYEAYATLVSMQVFDSYGGGQSVVQTWRITGVGGITGARKATVEVEASVETPKVSANSYAAFATAPGCGAIYFHGDVTVDSYDSSQGPPTGPGNSTEDSGGDVGTNGNLHIEGSVDVNGNLYTPRTGVGTCEEGGITALTETGSADVNGSVVQLPGAVSYPVPTMSVTPPTTAVTIDASLLSNAAAACTALGLTESVNCFVNAGTGTVRVDGNGADVTMPSVTVASGFKLVFDGSSTPGQTVNINALNGSGEVEINANLTGSLNESVILKVAGLNADSTEMDLPFDLSTMSWKQNSPTQSYDASALQIVYGGTKTISMQGGNSQSAAVIYAPNADFELQGTQDLFGSVLARTIENQGNANIHYDRRLSRDFYVSGRPMLGTFTWKRD
jgi:hypothetical protein